AVVLSTGNLLRRSASGERSRPELRTRIPAHAQKRLAVGRDTDAAIHGNAIRDAPRYSARIGDQPELELRHVGTARCCCNDSAAIGEPYRLADERPNGIKDRLFVTAVRINDDKLACQLIGVAYASRDQLPVR